jgi:NitT/TauT family transport system substrate-binding protein
VATRRNLQVSDVLLLILLCISACSGESADDATTFDAPVRVGYVPIADNAQLYVAAQQRFFDHAGMRVELVPLANGSRVIEAAVAASGDRIDIGFANVVSILQARAGGLALKVIAGGPVESKDRSTHALVVRKDSGIVSPRDLVGRSVAVNALKNIEDLTVSRYLRLEGIDPNLVRRVEVPFPEMLVVLSRGRVDAASMLEPGLSAAISDPNLRVLARHYVAVQPQTIISAYFSTERFIAERPRAIEGFADAIQKATAFIAEPKNDQVVRKLLIEYTKIDSEAAERVTIPRFAAEFSWRDLRPWADYLAQESLIPKAFEPRAMIWEPSGAKRN